MGVADPDLPDVRPVSEPDVARMRRGPADGRTVHEMALALSLSRSSNAALERRLSEMESSRSWRLTAALRLLGSFFRKRSMSTPVESIPLEAPAGIPLELRRLRRSAAFSDEMSRTIDGWPWLASMIGPHAFEAAAGALPVEAHVETGRVVRIGFRGDIDFAKELLCDNALQLLDGLGHEEQDDYVPPVFVLVAPDRRAIWNEGSCGETDRLADRCRSAGVPTVLWLRIHEGSAVDDLLGHIGAAAGHFDLVCVSDMDVARHAAARGFGNVRYLDDAVQPALHHPVLSPALRGLANRMAGGLVLDALADLVESPGEWENIEAQPDAAPIFAIDSYWDIPAAKITLVGPTSGYSLVGSVFESDKIVLSKLSGAEYFPESVTRPAWWTRIQKRRACAMGIRIFDPTCATISRSAVLAQRRALDVATIRDHAGLHRMAHQTMSDASWRARISSILLELGNRSVVWPRIPVSCLLVSKRPHVVVQALRRLQAQTYADCEIIVLMHGVDVPEALRAEALDGGAIQIMSAPASLCLGECLNLAFSRASGEFWFKFDDDDSYGPHYIEDLMRYASVLDHDLVGKPMAFHHFASDDALYCDPQQYGHANTLYRGHWEDGVVCGATLGGRRAVLETIPFPMSRRHGTDSAFLAACRREGLSLLVGDPFNFVACRSSDARQHTWVGNEAEVRTRGILLGGARTIDTQVHV